MNPARVDFAADLAYGVLIFGSIGLILIVGTDVGVAFGLGVLVAYVVHIAWKMSQFDPDWMTRTVTDHVTEEVSEEVEETVSEEIDEVADQVETTVEEEVTAELEETVSQQIEETVGREVEETVEETVGREVEETVEETVGREVEEMSEKLDDIEERTADEGGERQSGGGTG